ncbi:MAG TPA: cytochrome C oxidase assembly protein [Gammaproteobacteria bacterium]|nr:cytochrome C oxidase assembly protein [Gammaproteobacteria bacterium]
MSQSDAPPGVASAADKHVVEGEITWTVRLAGAFIAALILLAAALGVWRGLASPLAGAAAAAQGLELAQVVLAAALIMLGSMVEGFGFGLALGTRWPYTRNILVLMLRGDPEAAHRVVATGLSLVAVALAILDPGYMTFLGLGLIVATALFGMGVLYVLAGRAPAFVHGTHGLLAYAVFLTYLVALIFPGVHLGLYLKYAAPLHALLLTVFVGGMVTGQRGFGQPIGAFYGPRKASQWVFVAHGASALLVIGTLGWFMPAYPVAFALALTQAAVGFFLFHAVNLRPRAPGTIVAFHQAMVLLITTAIVLRW